MTLLILGLAASAWASGYLTGKYTKKGTVNVSVGAIEDAVSNGVLKKVNQQLLSDETGIEIKTFVGGKKNK